MEPSLSLTFPLPLRAPPELFGPSFLRDLEVENGCTLALAPLEGTITVSGPLTMDVDTILDRITSRIRGAMEGAGRDGGEGAAEEQGAQGWRAVEEGPQAELLCFHILVDSARTFRGAQSVSIDERDLSVRLNIKELAELLEMDRNVQSRTVRRDGCVR